MNYRQLVSDERGGRPLIIAAEASILTKLDFDIKGEGLGSTATIALPLYQEPVVN